MIKSMTGFGVATVDLPGKKVTAEIKTLNSKQVDLLLRLPGLYREKEAEIRDLLMDGLERGKIDLTVTISENGAGEITTINKDLVVRYYKEIRRIAAELGVKPDDPVLANILRLPDVLNDETAILDETEWQSLRSTILDAIRHCDEFRQKEGKKLKEDFEIRIQRIIELLNSIAAFESNRIQKLKQKFRKDLQDIVDEPKIDENRLEQELIYYIEKIDITEEKVRLKSHCDYFLETLPEPASNGKKLGFISQEIGREINTIGSKANDFDIQKIVVQMKDELEKIKEQLFNIL